MKKINSDIEKALGYWRLGFQYLDLSQKVSKLISDCGNKSIVVFNGLDFDKHDEEYNEATKWADHRQSIPVIFNFYHGIELLLKGLTISSGDLIKGHKLIELLLAVRSLHPEANFLDDVEKYINTNEMPNVLRDFITGSCNDINEWYEAFKYPESNNGKIYSHIALKYKQEVGAKFFGALSDDIYNIRVNSVFYVRSKYPELA